MGNYIHPSIFLIPENSSYKEYLKNIGAFFLNEHEDLFDVADYSIKVEEIIKFRPTFLKIEEYRNKDVIIKHPFVISFVDLSKGNVDYYFDFLETLKNSASIRDNEHSDFRFLNIIIRNLSRDSASTLNDNDFYERFEKFCKDNRSNQNVSLGYFYNIIIDNFNEITGYKFDLNDLVFKQLSEQLSLIIKPQITSLIALSNCLLPTPSILDSSVRYNSIGLSSVGFNQVKVAKCISFKRKVDFLQEIVNSETLEDNVYLEITREVQDLFNSEFKNIETDVKENSLNVSFQTDIKKDLENYHIEQDDCNLLLSKREVSKISNSILQRLDLAMNPFKEKLKTAEEEAISYSRVKEQTLNNSVKIFITYIFDKYNPENSIVAGLYSLKYLLEPQKQHIVTLQENENPATLKNKKNEISSKIVSIPKEDVYEEQRNNIREKITNFDNRIIQKYNSIEKLNNSISLKWLTKNLVNLILFPLLGIVLSIILFFTVPRIEIFGWKIIDLWNKILISLLPILIFCAIGFFRAYNLKIELRKQKKLLSNLTNDKNNAVQSYIRTYNTHFNLIINKIKFEQSESIISGNISFVNLQVELVNRFKDSLIGMQQDFKNRYNEFDFNQDYFNRSIIGKSEIEYYCNKNKSSFFSTKKLSSYFNEFTNDTNFFNSLRYTNIENDVSENEVIKPNAESFKENQHIYKEIEQFKTSTYLSTSAEKGDIIHSDVKQGVLGDCYLLAALASIANKKPEYIKSIIDDTKKNPVIYFYDELLQTHKIAIDKKFWVYKDAENPLYAQFGSSVDENREIWAMLIEKGWAKINGMDYTKINGDTRSGNIRKIDYSLALTGIKAIRENLELSTNIINTSKRIVEHNTNKPVVLYSVSKKNDKSDDDIITNHAYALLNIEGSKYEIYNPHGSIITIEENELHYNFDTVLYFDFNYQEDKHLFGIYSDYFIRNSDNNLIKEFDEVINEDNTEKIFNKSLEETLTSNIFNLIIDDGKKDNFTKQIMESSTPFVYLFNTSDNKYDVYFLGENKLLQRNIKEKLNELGVDTENIPTLESSEKRMGLLKLRNNLKLKNITNKPTL
jgi:hypothetical protein